jgi:hypothetical protein
VARRFVYDYVVETSIPSERMLAAAADFSARRPHYWPAITRKSYRVYTIGDRMAEVNEGSWPLYSRVRYEWSGDTVRGVTVDCTTIAAGSVWQLRARPRREDSGSIVDVHFDYQFKGSGLMVWAAIMLLGPGFLRKVFQRTVDILEKEQSADRAPSGTDPNESGYLG